ncbi:hypothetical protein PGT21_023676 [Puccinia graminis f. sp. tritici]|uniref:Uncharacterized protein n=1 Tax=Puccinia graminis f. sp. tritici TaxID=56615 RepID=A0A5B0M4N6_PUCGR|nr:hypothetical protein PGT21_023676 [Puccinia graminis f. sp. tritici]
MSRMAKREPRRDALDSATDLSGLPHRSLSKLQILKAWSPGDAVPQGPSGKPSDQLPGGT